MRRWIQTLSLILLIGGSFPLSLQAEGKDGTLDIYFIDVEGGAATLIVTPAGESILIDSGYPDYNGRDRDRILETLKDQAGLDHLDHAVVTHWHLDHYGNHAALAALIPIHNFWDRGIPDALQEDKKFDERIANYRAASQNKSKTLRAGETFDFDSNGTPLKITIVSASREVIENTGEPNPFASEHKPNPIDKSDNASSIGFLLEFGDFRFLCCGDLTWNLEAKLVTPNNPIGQVDLFMVTHHGLSTSNNPVFVKAIDPVVAVMCNGPTKGGHAETIATLKSCQSLKHLYQLHRNVTLGADEQTPAEFIANSEPTVNCEGIGVKATVAADGTSYTVQIGQAGTRNEYESRSSKH
ncbi:ComEC/Rec2 family competence protein [Thalassoglobus polymorphus]|uniref:ComEC family competence protein n=1 Tax=Thalassoglobus polymorphus TaxID=2527994 RepID=A0A517QRY1_9PLAN|nr:MBL fold metallo-hydrolase [Thalassoglobus polymorphus]QDT34394.1 ComEC family competence protein [Thalassoglobus polymorphus]